MRVSSGRSRNLVGICGGLTYGENRARFLFGSEKRLLQEQWEKQICCRARTPDCGIAKQNEKRAGYLLMALSVNFLFGMALFVPPTAQTPFIICPTTTNQQLILAAIQDSHKTRERNTYTKKDLFPRIVFPFIHWICCDYAFKKKRKIESSATVQIPS